MPEQFPRQAGTYIFLLRSRIQTSLPIGKLGVLNLRLGIYLYVGSAQGPGGLRGRLSHHLRGASKPHWHIDYLRQSTVPAALWWQISPQRLEHDWANALGQEFDIAMPRFGASDCRCASHLFFARRLPSLQVFSPHLRAAGLATDIEIGMTNPLTAKAQRAD